MINKFGSVLEEPAAGGEGTGLRIVGFFAIGEDTVNAGAESGAEFRTVSGVNEVVGPLAEEGRRSVERFGGGEVGARAVEDLAAEAVGGPGEMATSIAEEVDQVDSGAECLAVDVEGKERHFCGRSGSHPGHFIGRRQRSGIFSPTNFRLPKSAPDTGRTKGH